MDSKPDFKRLYRPQQFAESPQQRATRIAQEAISADLLRRGESVAVAGKDAGAVAAELKRRGFDTTTFSGDVISRPGTRFDVVVLTNLLEHSRAPVGPSGPLEQFRQASIAGRSVLASVPQRHNLNVFDPLAQRHTILAHDRLDDTENLVSVWTPEMIDLLADDTKLAGGPIRGSRTLVRWDRPARPNVWIWAPGHSATTQVVRLARSLGWYAPTVDDEFQEPVPIREFHESLIRRQRTWSDNEAARLLHEVDALALGAWVLKEPRWCVFWREWLPIFEPYCPTLLHLVRPLRAVQGSYSRRQGVERERTYSRGNTVEGVWRETHELFDAWPGPKLRLTTDQITAAAEQWDGARVAQV